MMTMMAIAVLCLQESPTIQARYELKGLPGRLSCSISTGELRVTLLDGGEEVRTWTAKVGKAEVDRLLDTLKKQRAFSQVSAQCHGECTDEMLWMSLAADGAKHQFSRCLCDKPSPELRAIFDALKSFVHASVPGN